MPDIAKLSAEVPETANARDRGPTIHRFKYLKCALALALGLIGSKIFLAGISGKIPAVISLSVTFDLIAGGVLVSL